LLFGGERIRKDDPRTEAYGTIDEAVAALGLARAYLAGATAPTPRVDSEPSPLSSGARAGRLPDRAELATLVLRFQRELFVAGAELATGRDAWSRLVEGRTRVSAEMVHGVEAVLFDVEARIEMPREFVVPGETLASAALELARAILRRAERRAVALDAAGRTGPWQPSDTVSEPARRLALGARESCRAGGVPASQSIAGRSSHHGAATQKQ
jgi:cob(I)alamin adenosyltransferase